MHIFFYDVVRQFIIVALPRRMELMCVSRLKTIVGLVLVILCSALF